jgi:hypothetical protein
MTQAPIQPVLGKLGERAAHTTSGPTGEHNPEDGGPTPAVGSARPGFVLTALSWLCLAVGLGIAAWSCWVLAFENWTTIVFDQWRIYDGYLASSFPENIVAIQNGHRPVFPGLFYVTDLFVLGGHNWLLGVVGIGMALGLCLWGGRLALGDQSLSAPFRRIAAGFLAGTVMWLASARVLGHGNESVHLYMVLVGMTMGIAGLSRAAGRRNLGEKIRATDMLLTVGGCTLATFSFGTGVASWVAVLMLVLVLRLGWRAFSVIVLGLVATLGLYVLAVPEGSAASPLNEIHLERLLPDLSVWLGAPVFGIARGFLPAETSKALSSGGVVVGCGILGGLGILLAVRQCVLAMVRRRKHSPLGVWSLGMTVFALGGGLITSIARGSYFLELPAQRMAPRYFPWAAFFWSGLVILGLIRLHALYGSKRRIVTLSVGGLLLVMLSYIPGQTWNARTHAISKFNIERTAMALSLGIQDDEQIKRNLFGRPVVVHRVAGFFRERESGMYAWEGPRVLGDTFSERFPELRTGALNGSSKVTATAPTNAGDYARVEGSIQITGPGAPAIDTVVFVDETGRIAGAGRFMTKKVGAHPLPAHGDEPADFTGFIPGFDPAVAYTAYGVAEGSASAASLGVVLVKNPK